MVSDDEVDNFDCKPRYFPIPEQVSDYESYGLWNCLIAYDQGGHLIDIVPAHDGDFFPESPLDHIELLRKEVQSDQSDHTSWPIRVDIDINQQCTRRCYFCYSKKYASCSLYRNAQISAKAFDTILEELAQGGTKSVRFTGGGESLLHPEIKMMLAMPKQHGLRSCIITNGDLLDHNICSSLVSSLDHIRISINAAREATRNRISKTVVKTAELSNIVKWIRAMVRFREVQWTSQKKPLIWSTFLILPENIREIFPATQMMKECGADSISFRPVYHKLSHQFSKFDYEILQKQLDLASGLTESPTFYVFTPKRQIVTEGHISPLSNFPWCISCNTRTIIEATNQGPMITVCGMYRGAKEGHLGWIKNGTGFADIWNSPKVKNILSTQYQICPSCIDISMNVTLNHIWRILLENHNAVFRKGWQIPSMQNSNTKTCEPL